MRPTLPILLSLATALTAADEVGRPKKLNATSLLPDGSQLKGVMIPRHDEQHRLTGSLRAELVTLVTDDVISGENVVIDFFNTNGSPRGRINLALATMDQTRGILSSDDPVAIDSETFHARGKGLHYAFQDGDGFLVGPATTWIKAPSETTMKSRTTSIIGATGLALISQSVAITNTQAAEDQQPVVINTVNPETPASAQNEAATQLAEDQQKSTDAAQKAVDFLEGSGINTAEILKQTNPDAKPLDVQIGPGDTVVNCDGGMYFDADNGLLVYLKNVTVSDPRFELTGANELKIFLTRKTAKPADDKKDDAKADPGAGIASFDEVDRIIATGAVTIVQRTPQKGKPPVKASGAIFTYRPKTGEILLSGGYPWVQQGTSFMRAKQPNLTLRIKQDGSFVTEGSWEMGGTLNSN